MTTYLQIRRNELLKQNVSSQVFVFAGMVTLIRNCKIVTF